MKLLRFIGHLLWILIGSILIMTGIFWAGSLLFFGWASALAGYEQNPTTLNLILYVIYVSPIFVGAGYWLYSEYKKFEAK